MPAKSPKTRPRITAQDVEEIARKHGVKDAVAIVGIRGYYLRTLGDPKKNDRGIWDDCIAVISPTAFAAYNGNTDPSFWRKGIASLVEGVHKYRKGKHGISRGNPYPALRPANPSESLPVTRDGQLGRSQGVAINIHRGGSINSVSICDFKSWMPDNPTRAVAVVRQPRLRGDGSLRAEGYSLRSNVGTERLIASAIVCIEA